MLALPPPLVHYTFKKKSTQLIAVLGVGQFSTQSTTQRR